MSFNDTNLICATSKRPANMSLVYGDIKNSLANRKKFLQSLKINYKSLVCAEQVHGSSVRYIREKDKGKGALSPDTAIARTDALITNIRNLPLAVFTADCLPIFLYDYAAHTMGLVHAGWRGTQSKIICSTVQLMQKEFNTKPRELHASFGPGIKGCCYEVGREFIDYFRQGLISRNKHFYLDLAETNKEQLLDSGLKKENIFDSKICTFCENHRFFSYRKEGTSCGRMISVMMLK